MTCELGGGPEELAGLLRFGGFPEPFFTGSERYFKERVAIPRWYQVHLGQKDVVVEGVRILPFSAFCREVGVP